MCSCVNSNSIITINHSKNLPSWAKTAIWYQIFVERFRNGNPDNNPIRESLIGAWPDEIPDHWKVTPWGQDWYKQDPWFNDFINKGFYTGVQARRYGGDLQGVLDKIPYLIDLGITAIYFNPLNDAPSLHKYDAAYYHHIDRHFGNNAKGDTKLIASENPADEKTWVWTNADELFLEIIRVCHANDIRVIMDYSFNHTGRNFWAFKDVLMNGSTSAYRDWYSVDQYDDINTPEDEFSYHSWAGAASLPELRKKITNKKPLEGINRAYEGNLLSESLKNHIYKVCQRWLDPNNNGNPSDGVDGFRLDVAAEVPIGFWRDFRTFVKTVKPEAYLVGEIWWEEWPNRLLDPQPFLHDCFDAVMNYRWYKEARALYGQSGKAIKPTSFVKNMIDMTQGQSLDTQASMMNLISGHDSPRAVSSLYNRNLYKQGANPKETESYRLERPDKETWKRFKLLITHQFTFVGAPQIWNGDEMGMWGADDPDNRKPLIWQDIQFDKEEAHPIDKNKRPDEVIFNQDIHEYYKSLIKLRKNNPVFAEGEVEFITMDDNKMILGYKRKLPEQEAIVIFNISNLPQSLTITNDKQKNYLDAMGKSNHSQNGKILLLNLSPLSAIILLAEKDKVGSMLS